jgi:hypothetical protein
MQPHHAPCPCPRRLVGVGLLLVVLLTQGADADDAKPGDKKPRLPPPRDIKEVVELQPLLAEGGLGPVTDPATLEAFVKYGSRERARRYLSGDAVERTDARREMEKHEAKLAGQAFALRGLPVQVPPRDDVDSKGLFVVARVGLRLFQTAPRAGVVRSKPLRAVHLSRVNGGETWFLKAKKLYPCSRAQARAIEKGLLYSPDARWTDVVLILTLDREAARHLSKNPRDYSLDLVIDRLDHRKPLEWGFYHLQSLLEADGDCDPLVDWNSTGAFGPDPPTPHYFRVDAARQEPCVESSLVAANLRDKKGQSVAWYLADVRYKPLLVNPVDQTSGSSGSRRPTPCWRRSRTRCGTSGRPSGPPPSAASASSARTPWRRRPGRWAPLPTSTLL